MKVYVVTSGSYSDYHIEAIFSTGQQAMAYIVEKDSNDSESIAEWEVDETFSDEANSYEEKTVYSATIDFLHGKLTPLAIDKCFDLKTSRGKPTALGQNYYVGERRQAWSYSYVSQEHANKLAVEARQEWLRSQL